MKPDLAVFQCLVEQYLTLVDRMFRQRRRWQQQARRNRVESGVAWKETLTTAPEIVDQLTVVGRTQTNVEQTLVLMLVDENDQENESQRSMEST